MVGVEYVQFSGDRSSVGRVPDCDSGRRGFESHRSPHHSRYIRTLALKFLRLLLIGLAGLATSGELWAVCAQPRFTNPQELRIQGDAVMIVTHASAMYDPRYSIKYGLDVAVQVAKAKKIPVIYLADDSPISMYMTADCDPDYWVYSKDGEIVFPVNVKTIYLAGGHVELCLSRTIHDLIQQRANNPQRHTTFTYLMDAIYSNGKRIDASDPFFNDFSFFMQVVSYGRPNGEWWPKLNLLETMGIIRRIEDDYYYLKKILPRWDRTFDERWQIDFQLMDFRSETLQAAQGDSKGTIRFNFIDTAEFLP